MRQYYIIIKHNGLLAVELLTGLLAVELVAVQLNTMYMTQVEVVAGAGVVRLL